MNLRLATRSSRLAVAQSGWVAATLERRIDGLKVELVKLVSDGDRMLDKPLWEEGGKGLFTREVDEAVRTGRADFAVHSLKDMPYRLADSIVLAAVPERANPADVLVFHERRRPIVELKRIATSSPRRVGAMRLVAPQAEVVMLRGNVDTRLRKLEEGFADAILLAEAGLQRLGLTPTRLPLTPDQVVPCAGQGCLAITALAGSKAAEAISVIDHPDSRFAAEIERGVLEGLQASCTWPVGIHATSVEGKWMAYTAVYGAKSDMTERFPLVRTEDGRQQGLSIADSLLAKGARALLA